MASIGDTKAISKKQIGEADLVITQKIVEVDPKIIEDTTEPAPRYTKNTTHLDTTERIMAPTLIHKKTTPEDQEDLMEGKVMARIHPQKEADPPGRKIKKTN